MSVLERRFANVGEMGFPFFFFGVTAYLCAPVRGLHGSGLFSTDGSYGLFLIIFADFGCGGRS